MKNKIGYLTFGRDDFGYGMALCLSSLNEYEIYRVTPKTARYVDFLLFSCFWWEHIYLLADFLRRAGIKKGGEPRIIVGGFNTFNPVPFQVYADAVICGDGEEVLSSVLSGADPILTWNNVWPLQAFCHETNDIARIELARGCRYRCRFCAVAHLKPYREVAIDDIEIALKSTRLKRVSLFAPEPTTHTNDKEITELCHWLGKTRTDSDVRLDNLSKRSDSVPRVGIEGLSEKLRKSVNKPYSNKRIVKIVQEAIEQGRKGLFMYLILDLPGEQDEDWQEFKSLLDEIGKLPGAANFLLKPSPSVFMPSPHTPMEYESIHWDRDYQEKWKSFFGRGEDRQWEVMIAERSRVFSPAMRILSMLSTRAGEEFTEIETELTKTKTIQISSGRVKCNSEKSLLKILGNYGGSDRYCGRLDETQAPWKILKLLHQEVPVDNSVEVPAGVIAETCESIGESGVCLDRPESTCLSLPVPVQGV